jgi:hypothetical protein
MTIIDPTNHVNEKTLAAPEVLTEDGVTPSNLALILKPAFYKTAFDDDGDLIVETVRPPHGRPGAQAIEVSHDLPP